MSSEQALQILSAATAVLQANREQHVQILKALEVLSKLVQSEAKTNA